MQRDEAFVKITTLTLNKEDIRRLCNVPHIARAEVLVTGVGDVHAVELDELTVEWQEPADEAK